MTTVRDYLGIGLIFAALLAGAGLAVLAYSRTPAGGAPGQAIAPSPPPLPELSLALALGDRDSGRTAFRSTCQECHTQGRQSFPPSSRERPTLLQTRIRSGAGDMPAFPPERLPDETLRHVLAYIAEPSHPEALPTPEPRIRGVNFEIMEASGRPGERVSTRFGIRDDAGTTVAPREMAALNLTVGGPTVGYRWARREDARGAESLPDGSFRYTFSSALPFDAEGTFTVAIEGYLQFGLGVAGPQPVRDTGFNVVSYFAVTDAAPVLPRSVVRIETCNQCHGTLATHGGTRRNTEFCVICHNVTQTDEEKRRTAGGPMPPEPVLFRNLIHRIHTGEDLSQPFVIYGGAPADPQPVDLSTVQPFPKDRANCAVCHEPGTFLISRALEQAPPMTVAVAGEVLRQVPPITAACTGCHDSARTLAHAASQTAAQGVETCTTCHGAGRPFAVSTVHRVGTGP